MNNSRTHKINMVRFQMRFYDEKQGLKPHDTHISSYNNRDV